MEAAQPPLIPLRRELRKPYFIYRTPDGIGSYLQREVARALFARKDPITRFLAAAQLTGPQVKPPAIEYDLEGRPREEFTPLDAVPDAEIKAFESAAREFLNRGDSPTERVTPHERELRLHFRLPDPDREPDAYWLYGPPHDRRLLILWGCEFEQDSSLPLLPGKGTSHGNSVLERLQMRRMQWSAKQAKAVELMRRNREPLAEFVLTPVYDGKGALKAVQAGGKNIPADAVSTPRYIPAAEIRRLEAAARQFYAKAHASDESTTPFEKELRSALRLPSPAAKPAAWVVVKSGSTRRLHVLLDGRETAEETLPIIDDEAVSGGGGELEPASEFVVDQLRQRIAPRGKFIAIGALGTVAAAAALVFSGVFADKTPPVLTDVVSENNPGEVRIVFDKALDPESLYSTEELAARNSPTPPIDPPRSHIDVRDRAGKRLPIAGLALAADAPSTVVVTLGTPLEEESYTLYLEGLRARKGPALPAKIEKSFDYRDRLAPKLELVSGDSGDARRLVLVFDEPLDDGRAARTRNYRLQGFEFTDAQLDPKAPNIVILTATTAFTNRERYTLAVSDVRDRSKERNELTQEISMEFVYRDTLPPAVEKIVADKEQIFAEVTFTEPVQESESQTPGNYVFRAAGEEKPFHALSAQLVDGARVVRLRTPALENGRDYTLKVLNVADRATPPVKIAENNETRFNYIGAPDLEGPTIEKISVREDGQRITLTYSEKVAPEALETSRYRVPDDYFKVTQVAADTRDDSGRSFHLTPDRRLDENRKFRVVATNIADLVGNVSPELTSREAERKGIRITPTNVLGFRFITSAPDGKTIEVEFTNEVTLASAKDPANYTLSDGVGIETIAIDETARDYRRVTLVLTAPLGAKKYTLTAKNLARNDNPNLVQREMAESFNGPGFSDF